MLKMFKKTKIAIVAFIELEQDIEQKCNDMRSYLKNNYHEYKVIIISNHKSELYCTIDTYKDKECTTRTDLNDKPGLYVKQLTMIFNIDERYRFLNQTNEEYVKKMIKLYYPEYTKLILF